MQLINRYKRNKYFVVLIVTLLLIVCSCSDEYTTFENKVTDTNNIKYLPITAQEGSMSYGLTDIHGNIEIQNTFYLSEDDSFEKFINIGNFVNHDSKYKILAFVDFKQSEFYVDAKEYSEFTVNIKEQTDLQIPIKLPQLEEGFHDIIFAIVTYPDIFLSDVDRGNSEMNHILYIRFKIIIDQNHKYSYKLTEFTTNNNGAIPEIFIHEDKDILKRLTTIKIKDNANLYLTIGNIYDEDKEFAIIFLKDWKQVSILNNQEVLYTKLESNQKFTIPIKLDFSEKGYHEINAILIEDPFGNYESISSVANSIRVGIINE